MLDQAAGMESRRIHERITRVRDAVTPIGTIEPWERPVRIWVAPSTVGL